MPSASHPLIYEVQTRHWLHALSEQAGRRLDLASVPDHELDRIAALGVTHLWPMGVWPSGERARDAALRLPELRRAYNEALPGWTDADVSGSPYAISAWMVADTFGGDHALATLRRRLASRGVGLLLDFIPNHTGLDHPWLTEHPEWFVHAPGPFSGSFPVAHAGRTVHVAHGADPFFPPWTDTAQLDLRRQDTRTALTAALLDVAARCDGVRCDMAMLVLADVFARTWGHVPCPADVDTGEFWADAIRRVRLEHPEFLLVAEAYWGLEDQLCALGFHAAYDKALYDLLVHDRCTEVPPHLLGLGGRNALRVHFLENHDEPRAAARLAPAPHRAAALLVLALPGVRLLHDGQTEGRWRFARVQLLRRAEGPDELGTSEVVGYYQRLLLALQSSHVGCGVGKLLEPRPAWDGNGSHRGFVLVQWHDPTQRGAFSLVVVNLAGHRAQCRAPLDVPGLTECSWRLVDLLGPERWVRPGEQLAREGLFLDVEPHAAQLFVFRPAEERGP